MIERNIEGKGIQKKACKREQTPNRYIHERDNIRREITEHKNCLKDKRKQREPQKAFSRDQTILRTRIKGQCYAEAEEAGRNREAEETVRNRDLER
jgi:hypothetical protein